MDNRTLEFTCEVACRTPAITGCNVDLMDTSDNVIKLGNISTIVIGSVEAISSRFVVVLVNDVDPTVEYLYFATPQAIVNGESLALKGIQNLIPALIKGMYATKYVSLIL